MVSHAYGNGTSFLLSLSYDNREPLVPHVTVISDFATNQEKNIVYFYIYYKRLLDVRPPMCEAIMVLEPKVQLPLAQGTFSVRLRMKDPQFKLTH